jgi:hypothetical protein
MTTSTEGVASADTGEAAASDRMTKLSTDVRGLRTRKSGARLDRFLLIGGAILMPLGVVLIILGWANASRTTVLYEQNNYLISGGILGLGVVIIGGFLYFAYWQSVRVHESRTQAADLTRAVGRLEALLAGGAVVGIADPTETTFVATSSGSIYHRADCPVVDGRDDLSNVDPATTQLRPCRICTPHSES